MEYFPVFLHDSTLRWTLLTELYDSLNYLFLTKWEVRWCFQYLSLKSPKCHCLAYLLSRALHHWILYLLNLFLPCSSPWGFAPFAKHSYPYPPSLSVASLLLSVKHTHTTHTHTHRHTHTLFLLKESKLQNLPKLSSKWAKKTPTLNQWTVISFRML